LIAGTFMAYPAQAQFSDLFPSLKLMATKNSMTDQAAWEELKKDPKDPSKIAEVIRLASMEDHPDAQNYAGCLHVDGKLVRRDQARALEYFEQAADSLPLARLNLGIMRLMANIKDQKAWDLVADAFEETRIKQAGELVLYYQAATRRIDETLLNVMYTAKSPLAYYLKAYALYLQGDYLSSLNISLSSSDFGDLDSMLLASKNHFALAEKDPSNRKQALKWQYIYQIYSSKGKQANDLAHVYIDDEDESAWREASQYTRDKKIVRPNYFQPICEPKNFVGN